MAEKTYNILDTVERGSDLRKRLLRTFMDEDRNLERGTLFGDGVSSSQRAIYKDPTTKKTYGRVGGDIYEVKVKPTSTATTAAKPATADAKPAAATKPAAAAGQSDAEKRLIERAKAQPTKQRTEYKVRKGDTLSQIAKAAGMTLPQLKALNPSIKDYNKVGVGQILSLEKGNATSPYTGVSKSEMARMARDTAANKAKTTSKKRGGKVGKPRGVGAATRGYGKAMMRGGSVKGKY